MGGAGITGGCQCGAVRYAVDEGLGRAGICHCRMCQKAMGGFYGPYVTVHGLRWTRGTPKRFQSSDQARRGFCGDCGTPLTFESAKAVDVAIGTLDRPEMARPALQLARADRIAWVDDLPGLPARPEPPDLAGSAPVVSRQHPDHDTSDWAPPA